MRIVLVEPNLGENGAIRVSLDRADRWQQAGADVDLFVVGRGATDPAAVPPGLPVRYGTARPRRERVTLPAAVLRLIPRARRADVVVAGRETGAGLLVAAAAARAVRRPLAVTVQSNPVLAIEHYVRGRLRDLTRRAILSADLAVPVSAGLVPPLVDLGLSEHRIRVVVNGMDVGRVRRAGQQEATVPLPDAPYVAVCGQLSRQKGTDLVLRAHAKALADGAPPHHVVLVGAGPERQHYEGLAAELGVTESVHFAGFVTNPYAVMARATLLLSASRWEGFPLVLVEALSIGVPVVAADCVAGPREVLADGAYGRLVPPEDPDAIALAVSEHLRDPAVLRERAAEGARQAATRFAPDVAARRHLEHLTALASRQR